MSRRVVLTGLGVVSPLGLDLRAFRQALCERKSGVRPIASFDPAGLPIRIAAEVQGFDARDYLEKKDRKSLKMMARTVQLAVAAARMALEDAGLRPAHLDPARLGVTLGVGTIPGDVGEEGPAAFASHDADTGKLDLKRWGQEGMALLQPMWMLNHVPNMASCHVSILHNARGPNNTIVQTDAAGLLAMMEAASVIRRGAADVMITGGTDTRTELVAMIRYCAFAQVSRRHHDPEKASRPFDRGRDGQVLGEGAGLYVIEELEHARLRGARIYAELLSSASAFDRGRTGAGMARCVRASLGRAQIAPDDLDHISAHAPSTTGDDIWEARGLAEALGGAAVPVLAASSYFGNLGAASAPVELAASLLALADGCRPGTLNHDETDPECPILVARESARVRQPCVLKTVGTDRGQCAAMALRRWE
jgi:3-oxoacyl-[acyl-carrier-protein] synthase II